MEADEMDALEWVKKYENDSRNKKIGDRRQYPVTATGWNTLGVRCRLATVRTIGPVRGNFRTTLRTCAHQLSCNESISVPVAAIRRKSVLLKITPVGC